MLDWHRRQIMQRLDAGSDLDEIEDELINSLSEVSDDERAALWLFAWSYRHSPARAAAPLEQVVTP